MCNSFSLKMSAYSVIIGFFGSKWKPILFLQNLIMRELEYIKGPDSARMTIIFPVHVLVLVRCFGLIHPYWIMSFSFTAHIPSKAVRKVQRLFSLKLQWQPPLSKLKTMLRMFSRDSPFCSHCHIIPLHFLIFFLKGFYPLLLPGSSCLGCFVLLCVLYYWFWIGMQNIHQIHACPPFLPIQ